MNNRIDTNQEAEYKKVKQEYVVGFMFNKQRTLVTLIHKLHPDWQKGNWNGVGGKIEKTDGSIYGAMVREFEEEAGVVTKANEWDWYCTINYQGAVVYCFRCFSNDQSKCKTMEEEKIQNHTVGQIKNCTIPIISNLHWLIPLALDEDIASTTVTGVIHDPKIYGDRKL